MGSCCLPWSLINAALIACSETAKYSINSFLWLRIESTGGLRYCLICTSALSHYSSHTFSGFFLRVRNMGRHLSELLDWKRLRAASIPVNLCTSFLELGCSTFCIAWIWLGLASIPLWVTMYSMNFPELTPNKQFEAFSFSLYLPRMSKIDRKSSSCITFALLLTTMSSI